MRLHSKAANVFPKTSQTLDRTHQMLESVGRDTSRERGDQGPGVQTWRTDHTANDTGARGLGTSYACVANEEIKKNTKQKYRKYRKKKFKSQAYTCMSTEKTSLVSTLAAGRDRDAAAGTLH